MFIDAVANHCGSKKADRATATITGRVVHPEMPRKRMFAGNMASGPAAPPEQRP